VSRELGPAATGRCRNVLHVGFLKSRLVKKQAELKYLDETSRKELNCPVEELAPADDPIPAEEAIAEAEQAALEVRNGIEALGAVNAAAMEEHQEAQQRQDFLTAQRQDLIDSIRDTEKAIQDIDQVSRQRFSEAFEGLNDAVKWEDAGRLGASTGQGSCRGLVLLLALRSRVSAARPASVSKYPEGSGTEVVTDQTPG
jgi:hypothetical protein